MITQRNRLMSLTISTPDCSRRKSARFDGDGEDIATPQKKLLRRSIGFVSRDEKCVGIANFLVPVDSEMPNFTRCRSSSANGFHALSRRLTGDRAR